MDIVKEADNLQITNLSLNDGEDLIYFTNIDEATKNWIKYLNDAWKLWKRSSYLIKTLKEYFITAPNPYLSIIRILVNIPDFMYTKTKSSLAFTVIEEFSTWLQMQPEEMKTFLVTDLKLAAFRLIIQQGNIEFSKIVAKTYELVSGKEAFLPLIKKMIQEKKYKHAAQYASLLELQANFEEPGLLMLPLILQNKLTVLEDFLKDCPSLQQSLVQYLDTLVATDNQMHIQLEEVIREYDIPNVQMSITQSKSMGKLITRLVKLYNLKPEFCPNVNRKRSSGALQFLVHKRYVQRDLSTASWREMVEDSVGNNETLQLTLITLLINAKDTTEGLYWAKKFNIPRNQWPWPIMYEEQLSENKDVNVGASGSTLSDGEIAGTSYHKFKLSPSSIQIISTEESFAEFITFALRNERIVGIDSEWKPSFGVKKASLALMQIATPSMVYILDVTTLGNDCALLWQKLGHILFKNSSILKLGFGLAQDMTVMRESIPVLSHIKTYGHGYLDIVQLWKKLIDDHNFVFPHNTNESFVKTSLTALVELCFGEKLDKSNQFSNWEHRPLRESQIIYAALDAYCLLEIYQTLELQCEYLSIPFHDVCLELQHIPNLTPKPKAKKKRAQWPPKSQSEQSNIGMRGKNVKNGRPVNDYQGTKHHNGRFGTNSLKWNEQECMLSDSYFSETQNRVQRKTQVEKVPAHNWRVICDAKLGRLARYLRICGCDCICLQFDRNGKRAFELAYQENRIFLTCNKKYLQFPRFLRRGQSYFVKSDNLEGQLREILCHYNVVVKESDIFSRCQACNGDEFAKVSKSEMDELIQSYTQIVRQHNYDMELLSHPDMEPNSDVITDTNDSSPRHDNFYQLESENRTWILSTNSVNIGKCLTKYQTRIQVESVPLNILKYTQHFYICEMCGKIYWDGRHLGNTLVNIIKDIVQNSV